MDTQTLRTLIEWHKEYKPEWDRDPKEYVDRQLVGWGKSRRLGLLRYGRYKAYLGVQHIDPERPGWRIVDAPQARFFASLFVDGACITLRTFPDMDSALAQLAATLPRP